MMRLSLGTVSVVTLVLGSLSAPVTGAAENSLAPDFVPELVLAYSDPATDERVECGAGCRRMSVPDGVEVEVHVKVFNRGGLSAGDGVAWDLWLDQPLHPFPGLDLGVCFDADGRLDRVCWESMRDRVDRELWDDEVADRVCVPTEPGACRSEIVRFTADSSFAGARRQGTYHVALWLDRFGVVAERNEFDNFAGPVRVIVEPGTGGQGAPALEPSDHVVIPASPQPYAAVQMPATVERGFSLANDRARAELEFVPDVAGEVLVEVDQGGGQDTMIVTVRKALGGEVMIEGRGRVRLELKGRIGVEDLKDDRRLVVEVQGGPGTRGLRGVIRVEYPARTLYRVAQ
jgi:hypothetical protein